MKKIKNFIRRLSLTQQLFVIVAFTLAVFLIFSLSTLTMIVDRFVNNQIYSLIHRTQQNVIYNYNRGLDDADLYGANDPNVIHVIRTRDNQYYSNGMNRIDQDFLNQIIIQMEATELSGSVDYRYKDGSLYTVTTINKNATIATLITSNYTEDFKKMLVNNVINMILIVMAVLFLLLLCWVTYIIHPINQIRGYIKKVRNNEEAELKVDRDDEIGDVAKMLVAMNEEIQRQQKSKEEMIQNISHDLKTPVATIKSYGESIKDGVYPYETLEKSVDVIIEHAERLENKVHNLLTLNRMDYLTYDQNNLQQISLKDTIERVIVSSKQIRPEIDIILEVEDGSYVTGQEEPWRVVIENLLDNALRYAASTVRISAKPHAFSIFNDGKLIRPDQLEHLFNAYETGEGGQFGLGLSIVSRVVSNYGYTVRAVNQKDGVQFIIEKTGGKYERKK